MNKKRREFVPWVVTDNKNRYFECIVCLERFNTTVKPAFDTGECDHKTCQDCLRSYLNGILNDNTYTEFTYIECPGSNCNKFYYANEVVNVIFSEEEATDWWIAALCSKAYISNKIHCPHKGCTGVFDADDEHTKQCTFAECYQCHKGLCITCQTAWHPELTKVVNDAEELNKTINMAKNKQWCKCPYCSQLVERKDGCASILCRCGKYFCYICGGRMAGYGRCLNNCQSLNPAALEEVRNKMYINTGARN